MGGVEVGKRLNNRILEADADIQGACESLRDYVDNINKQPSIKLVGSVYRGRGAADKVHKVRVSGVEIVYRIEDHETFMRRQVFIKVPGYRIGDLTDLERERILTAVCNVILVVGGNMPEIACIAPDCMLLQQDFVPMYLVERSPGLVSIAGGFDGRLN